MTTRHMKRRMAQLLRRTANRLDPPQAMEWWDSSPSILTWQPTATEITYVYSTQAPTTTENGGSE